MFIDSDGYPCTCGCNCHPELDDLRAEHRRTRVAMFALGVVAFILFASIVAIDILSTS